MEAKFLLTLVNDLMPPLVLYARQWCRGAEDVVQEAFVRLAAQGALPRQPRAWLFKVVRNRAISLGRSERRRERHESLGAARRQIWFIPAQSPLDAELDPLQAMTALENLPDEPREVVILHLWGGLSFTEIATLLNSSRSTVHRQYQEAIRLLRERLGIPCPPTT